MKQQLAKALELQQQNTELLGEKSALLEQIDGLTADVQVAKTDGNRAKAEIDVLSEEIKKLEKLVAGLKSEVNGLLSKQTESKRTIQDLSILKSENAVLKAAFDELKIKNMAIVADGSLTSDKEKEAFEEKISNLEDTKASLETSLQAWTDLAKVRHNIAFQFITS